MRRNGFARTACALILLAAPVFAAGSAFAQNAAPNPQTGPFLRGSEAQWALNAAQLAASQSASDPATLQTPLTYTIRQDYWSERDERDYSAFIAALGETACRTVDECLKHPANPFRASDPAWLNFRADCADLPYLLRAYFAWKRGLPFAYETEVSPLGRSRDIRYSARGNAVSARREVLTGSTTGPALFAVLRDTISSAMYRVHPSRETPYATDHYSAALSPAGIRPGTLIYDPNGHLGVVYKVEEDGRVHFFDAHPDNSLTRGVYDRRFVRARPAMSAGFKNWRSLTLVGAVRDASGNYLGGRIVAAANAMMKDFSLEQFYGNDAVTPDDQNWAGSRFTLNGEIFEYYDYVRARLAGGRLDFEPVAEIADMVRSNCADLQYRVEAVQLAVDAGINRRTHPATLPENIYGTEGDWEIYSSPSRDARLKTAFKELRDTAERFIVLQQSKDPKLRYTGNDLPGDLIRAYDRESAACSISYRKSDGAVMALSYEEVRRRLFALSFDPYHCPELRWGASSSSEIAACRDDGSKRAWYVAEQKLRNQLDRTYEARMDHDLGDLRADGGKGVGVAPDIDVRAFLMRVAISRAQSKL